MRSKLGMHEPLASRRCSRCSRCTASASSGAVHVISLLCSHRSGRRRLPSTKRGVGADDGLTSRLEAELQTAVGQLGYAAADVDAGLLSALHTRRCALRRFLRRHRPDQGRSDQGQQRHPACASSTVHSSLRSHVVNERAPSRARPPWPDVVVQPLERVWCPHGTQRSSAEAPTCRPPGGGQPIRSRDVRPDRRSSQTIARRRACCRSRSRRAAHRPPCSTRHAQSADGRRCLTAP